MRVITYNIRLDTEADGHSRWANRRKFLVGQLRLLQPAILGMQEVLPNQRRDLQVDLPGLIWLGGGRDDGALAGEASPLMVDTTRLRIVRSGMFWLSPTPQQPSLGWDAAYRRVATWAHLVKRDDGSRILAINTHWDHIGIAARLNGAQQMQDWIKANLQPGESVVLLGDFNAPVSEPSLQVLLAPTANQTRIVLRDARTAALEPAVGGTATFNGYKLIPDGTLAIDHILTSRNITVLRHHTLAEHFDGRLASDHFPVIADLAVSRSATGCAAATGA